MSGKPKVLEPHLRHSGSAVLFIDTDAAWYVGTSVETKVKVQLGDVKSIDDSTFGFSAIAAEKDGDGFLLFVRLDTSDTTIVSVKVSATGQVDPNSIAVLTREQIFAIENQYQVDLDDSDSFGGEPLLLEGGDVNLYFSADQVYLVGTSVNDLKPLNIGGTPLTEDALPPGWKIVEVEPSATGFDVYALEPTAGVIFNAKFNSNGDFTGGELLSAEQLAQVEQTLGQDIDGNSSVPAPSGWAAALKTESIRNAVNGALASEDKISYAEAVAILQGVVADLKTASAAVSADQFSDLQAIASRGRNVFGGANDSAVEYLSYTFSKVVEGSEANKFYTGGEARPSELGSLATGSSVATLEKLLGKWLLGSDLPSTATAGDSATGQAKSVIAPYAKSTTGTLFVDGISLADAMQGTTGNCYMVAAVGGLAGSNSGAITAMIVENGAIDGARTWGVRFYDANGKAHWVTVNDMLPVEAEGSTKLAYGGAPGKDLNGEIWFSLVEKAYAQVNSLGFLPRDEQKGQNSYASVEGGQGDPLAQVVPGRVIAYSFSTESIANNPYITLNRLDKDKPADVAALVDTLKAAANAGKTVWIGVDNTVKDSFGNKLLVGSHAHYLLDPDPVNPSNTNMVVYNPWGISNLPNPPGPVQSEFVSPATYELVDLVAIPGLDFMILEPVGP